MQEVFDMNVNAVIKARINSLWLSDDLLCAVAAPTGLAAFNINGITKAQAIPTTN